MTVTRTHDDIHWAFPVFGLSVFLVLLYLVSLFNYLLFHSLVEGFRVVVAYSILMFSWNSRQFQGNQYFVFLGVAFLFIGTIDLFHTLTYKGIGIFPEISANLPTQLWIAARYMEGISLLVAPVFLTRKIRLEYLLGIYLAIFVMIMVSTFNLDIFPDCYLEDSGLTPFKKISEYVISFLLVAAAVIHYRHRSFFEKDVATFILVAIFLAVFAELAFTFYVSVFGFFNAVGHILKVISVYLIYKAVIETGLTKPHHILLRDLNHSKDVLAASQKELDTIIKNIPDIIYRLDKDGQITFISNAIESYGYHPDQLIGKDFFTMIHPDDRENARYRVGERRTRDRKTYAFEVRMCGRNGNSWESFEVSAEGLYSTRSPSTETFLGTQGIAKNITDRKEAEMERIYRTKLQGVIEMAGAVCHELNSPMQTIMGYADLISMDNHPDESLKKRLNMMLREVERMSNITKRIMHITRYETKPYTKGETIIDIEKASEDIS